MIEAEERARELMRRARDEQGKGHSARTAQQRRDRQIDALNLRLHALVVLLAYDLGLDVE